MPLDLLISIQDGAGYAFNSIDNNNNSICNAPFAKGYKAPGIITARIGANFENKT